MINTNVAISSATNSNNTCNYNLLTINFKQAYKDFFIYTLLLEIRTLSYQETFSKTYD